MNETDKLQTDPEVDSGLPLPWSLIPHLADVPHPRSWAEASAAELFAINGWDDADGLERMTATLELLLHQPLRELMSWRFMFLADQDLGPCFWDIGLFPMSLGGPTLDEVVSAATPEADLGTDVQAFELESIQGIQRLAVTTRRTDEVLNTGDRLTEDVIVGCAAVGVQRPIAALGQTTLLATAATSHLEPLLASLLPMQYLITSPLLEQLIAHAEPTR
mgnify:CR=1 FL=1